MPITTLIASRSALSSTEVSIKAVGLDERGGDEMRVEVAVAHVCGTP